MQYATRTTADGKKQLLAFRLKKNRDEYCWFDDGTAIDKAAAKALMPTSTPYTAKGVNCIYTVQNVAS